MEKRYKCKNMEKGLPCDYHWNGDVWNKEVDTEYTRNEKCPRCGSKDITEYE